MRNIKPLLVAMGLAGTLGLGCKSLGMNKNAQTYPLQISHVVPAAKGDVKITPQEGGNHRVEVKVDHMAPASLASPGATTYVVWLKPEGTGRVQNVGTLPVGSNREGHFETVTPFTDFEVLVTPEKDPQAVHPSNTSVLKASISPAQRGIY